MKKFNNISIVLYILLATTILQSCNVERYRRNHKNKLTTRAKKSQHYLSKQAKNITAKNIKNKDAKFKESEKRQTNLQADLNELNKPKTKKFHTGKFSVY